MAKSTNFAARIRQEGSVSILAVSGRMTSFEVAAFRETIDRLLKEGRKQIVLNLRELQYLDSSGIGELAKSYVSVVKRGGEMRVVGLSSKVEEVLKITQLYQVFPEFSSEEEAMRDFSE
ncbi:MAG TPA: STAS domain-containing protein [Candidatus Angelobacter sp.]|nr:STAS domain-containing protein [Candidatus Angelobacter sp.]